jgi:VanZ family protein
MIHSFNSLMMAIFEVFYQPGKLFESLPERRGVWILPLIVNVLLVLGVTIAVVQLIGMDTIVRQQIQNTRLSPEQMQTALNRASSPSQVYITYGGAIVGAVLSIVVIAALLRFIAMVGSKQPQFGPNFAMVTLALLPYRLIVCLMTVLVLYASPDRTSVDVTNILATNVGAFVNKETMSRGLYTFLSQLDILTFFEIGLMSYGFSKVNRTSVSFGVTAVISLWLIYVLTRTAFSLLF